MKTEELIAKLLIQTAKTLAVAESCTGGLISSLLTDISGSSQYTKVNFVTYSNEAKHEYLGVENQTLEEYGAVSEQVAKEMAQGIIKNTGSDFALSTTGIAGPNGGSDKKPVGLIYIGVASKDKSIAFKYNADDALERTVIKTDFANKALEILYEFLTENLKWKK